MKIIQRQTDRQEKLLIDRQHIPTSVLTHCTHMITTTKQQINTFHSPEGISICLCSCEGFSLFPLFSSKQFPNLFIIVVVSSQFNIFLSY